MHHLSALAEDFGLPLFELQTAAGLEITEGVKIQDLEEAHRLYYQSSSYDGNTRALITHKWNLLCEEAIEAAWSITELKRIYTLVPSYGLSREKLFLKWLQLATTIDEVRSIHERCMCHIKVKHETLEKWKDLSTQAIEAATTLDEAMESFKAAPSVIAVKISAIQRCLQFANTADKAKFVCMSTNATSECREIALRHWLGLADSISELREVYKHCFERTDIRREVLQKIIRLYEPVLA